MTRLERIFLIVDTIILIIIGLCLIVNNYSCQRKQPCEDVSMVTQYITPLPSFTPQGTPCSQPTPKLCNKAGTVWEKKECEGDVYQINNTVILGDKEETCWILGQVMSTFPSKEIWFFAIQPGLKVTLKGFCAGEAQFFGNNKTAVVIFLAEKAKALREEIPDVPIDIAILPEDASRFPLVGQIE
ncbi:MAG: hypothetical protein M1514_00705 [Patescibacteria group bacterium]|nr:hypothetical protein [Patescibacteria group bacterium]